MLIVTQLIKKYPAFIMEPEGYRVHKSPPLDPILSHLERELQMVQLSASGCSCIAIL